ncbi:MAG: DEAD/DEAH box helicase family protein [Betaproteobacteria bacterium]|nr:DEAD/DEAH box helicase family protein [Betaproteobacteria bacterium]
MLSTSPEWVAGSRVTHPELGTGVFIGLEPSGYARVFFREQGERQVPVSAITRALTWDEEVISQIRPATREGIERLWLAIEAEQLPLLENAATLTAAKVDLLPHQIVLTYRIANASPRRFLIADSVGLGKTIETALVLRELASRGELTRALMVVPAGLVNNWRCELNDTFNLDFEVFGSEGDVTDRKSNAFAKHNRLIASIDTLKRPARVKKILEAPQWDLIVFDEAHHLTAYQTGTKVSKTQNFRLAEALRDHSRDLLLLSATPHQGDHFRFWMLVRLLNPSLFLNTDDMLHNRYRLNSVVFRRTQADACDTQGNPLFSRRQVHTQVFHLSPAEARFYEALLDYLRDGYNLAEAAGNQGRALGFVMTIFQKIAASSFAAVGATLRRRLLSLTIHEAIVCDQNLDVDGRERALTDTRTLLHAMFNLPADSLGRAQVERLLADARVKLLRKLGEKAESVGDESETQAAADEESAALLVTVAIPAERERIRELLKLIPAADESKTTELLRALDDLWAIHPREKIVVFTTYLGSVDTLRAAIDNRFPNAGADVLKGGDHGAKLAAERRFKRSDGPLVLICTAAGREGINLQFARVLFNHDLPWNPMDLEQRIGRIHRYGQTHTAQVYNLVSVDTLEGKIFLLLEEKLLEIAKTLGKVDEFGQVTEDLRGQILGQLSERLSYDKLYQDAVRDPRLIRTREELDVAIDNARTARQVVWELFQDLESFRLDDYQQMDDGGEGMARLARYFQATVSHAGGQCLPIENNQFEVALNGQPPIRITTDREAAKEDERLSLLGLEHPLVKRFFEEDRYLEPTARGWIASSPDGTNLKGVLTIWHVQLQDATQRFMQRVIPVGLDRDGNRCKPIEHLADFLGNLSGATSSVVTASERAELVATKLPEMLRRDLAHRGLLSESVTLAWRLLAWVELV